MRFFHQGLLLNLLLIAAVLALAALLRKAVPALRRLAVPDSILAGAIGFGLGPAALGLLPFDQESLEVLVYHGLAIVFIAVGLQRPVRRGIGGGARSFAFAMPFMAVLQAAVGMGMVLLWTLATAETLHPGFGLLLPLGFQQGPGQALAIGSSWEATGFASGGQIGLIVASIGFVWCVFGVPLVAVARKRGWLDRAVDSGAADEAEPAERRATADLGSMEALTVQVVAIGVVYLGVYLALLGIDRLLVGRPQLAAQVWGFHFILGAGLALLARQVLQRTPAGAALDDALLSRTASLVVDFTTAAALIAIQLSVLRAWIGPLLLITTAGGIATLLACLWLGRRAFPDAPFQHALVLFGASTGTMPTGLALLRILDPELRGPVARNMVLGTTGAIVLGLPLVLVVMPLMVSGWASGSAAAMWTGVAILVAYVPALLVGWRYLGPLRFTAPLWRLWPRGPAPVQTEAAIPERPKASTRSA